MWRIVKGLYLGDRKDAYEKDMLRGVGITHILNCAYEIPCWYKSDFRYLHLRLQDPDEAFIDHIESLCKFIGRGRKRGGVLVHCAAGLSRSPSAILAYLCHRGRTLDEALDLLQRKVGEASEFIEPDATFLAQIEHYFDEM